MKAQEIFEKVAKHLVQQGRPAKTPIEGVVETVCAYRGEEGTSCAVGCLIPDELYDPKMENSTAYSLITKFTVPAYFNDHITLLERLQSIHDADGILDAEGYFVKEKLIGRLESLGERMELDIAFLKGL